MKKQDAILIGFCLGETAWEFFRFSPILPYKILKQYKDKDIKYIVFTRPDRFDMYGEFASTLIPLRIENDNKGKYIQDCFRLINFPNEQYELLINKFRDKYKDKYNILEHIYPDIKNKQHQNKNQFKQSQMIYEWRPRKQNKIEIDNLLNDNKNKKSVVIASRYREGVRRNWSHWIEFYDMIDNDNELKQQFNFIICGKPPDYIPDPKQRFYDINNIQNNDISQVSTAGFTIESIKRSILTVGSQSGIPNMSMYLGIPVLEFGHQRTLHTKVYNVKNTKIHFIEDMKYQLSPKILFDKMKKILIS